MSITRYYEHVKIAWESRSIQYGMKPEGVLPKSLPTQVNQALDDWMYQQIRQQILKCDQSKPILILDLGCGYGRLSKRVVDEFPRAYAHGIDVAEHYVVLYNKFLDSRGQATAGDIRQLPFKSKHFNVVFIITTLMYLNKKIDQKIAVKELLRVLKPNGKFIFIERSPNGHNVMTAWGLFTLLRGKSNKEISSVSFKPDYLNTLIRKCGGRVTSNSGIPILTASLPLLILISYIYKPALKPILSLIASLDRICVNILRTSLYIAYTGEKP